MEIRATWHRTFKYSAVYFTFFAVVVFQETLISVSVFCIYLFSIRDTSQRQDSPTVRLASLTVRVLFTSRCLFYSVISNETFSATLCFEIPCTFGYLWVDYLVCGLSVHDRKFLTINDEGRKLRDLAPNAREESVAQIKITIFFFAWTLSVSCVRDSGKCVTWSIRDSQLSVHPLLRLPG